MSVSEKTYEMLWDCKYCGQRKNLGLSHRHCPNCGAPQDPAARYYPSDAEKIAVQDHPYFGADVLCPACRAPNSRNAKCCVQCGSPLANAVDVRLQQDQVVGAPPGPPAGAAPAAVGKRRSPLVIVLPILGVLALVGVGIFFLLRTRAGSFTVVDKTWERTIDVEQLSMAHGSAWCDSLPSGARALSRHREQRSTKQIPDGQTCVTRRKDQGNGTFKEVQECTPKFRDEPVMDDRCDYEAQVWTVERTASSKGGANEAPSWPPTNVTGVGCSSLGCEREGKRVETYHVKLREPTSGEESTCDFEPARWQGFAVGSRYDGRIGAMTGHIDCSSLVGK